MHYRSTMNSELLIRLLWRLIGDAEREVLVILDNLRIHGSKPAKA